MLEPFLDHLARHGALSEEQSYDAFGRIMRGASDDEQIERLLALLAARPVRVDELTGAARVMREHVTPVPISDALRDEVIDTCGTGGAPKAFNVSTVAAMIVAGCGVPVAKHGNRSRTGRGSAEVLTTLGVRADASPETQARCLEEARVCFSFAIHHHPAIKHAMPARRALGHPTIFNLLGPMTNPAGARRQLIGCYDAEALETIAQSLKRLGAERAMVCRGDDGLDELTTTDTSTAYVLDDGRVTRTPVDAAAFGLERSSLDELRVGSVEESAALIEAIVDGQRGVRTDIALLNASAALVVAGAAGDLGAGLARAAGALEEGAARRALEDLKRVSHL